MLALPDVIKEGECSGALQTLPSLQRFYAQDRLEPEGHNHAMTSPLITSRNKESSKSPTVLTPRNSQLHLRWAVTSAGIMLQQTQPESATGMSLTSSNWAQSEPVRRLGNLEPDRSAQARGLLRREENTSLKMYSATTQEEENRERRGHWAVLWRGNKLRDVTCWLRKAPPKKVTCKEPGEQWLLLFGIFKLWNIKLKYAKLVSPIDSHLEF